MAKWDLDKVRCPRCEELEAKQQETFQMYVDANEARIDAEKKLRKSALQELSALGQASEAYQAQLAAEAKLAQQDDLVQAAVAAALREAINRVNGCDRISEVQPAILALIRERGE